MTHEQQCKLEELCGDTMSQNGSEFYEKLLDELIDRGVENVFEHIDDDIWVGAISAVCHSS